MNENLLQRIKREEVANWLGTPRKYQAIDFLGVGLGSYFLWEALKSSGKRTGVPWINVGLGAIMVYIHSERFFYAPQTFKTQK